METRNTRRGFTLIELLVVVLIIGILATVALPQYQKAVERARVAAEVLPAFNAFRKSADAYLLENGGYPSSSIEYADFASIDIPELKHFPDEEIKKCNSYGCEYGVYGKEGTYYLSIMRVAEGQGINVIPDAVPDQWYQFCMTQLSDEGRKICHSLEGLGFLLVDDGI